MQVRDVMTANPACCTPDTPLQEVAGMMVQHDCGAIPVVENQQSKRLMGMITDRDITCRTVAQGRNPLEMKARDAMSSPVESVSPDMDVTDCIERMEKLKVRRMPVTDDQGRCCGIVAQADIAHTAPTQVAGELVDQVSDPTEEPSLAGAR